MGCFIEPKAICKMQDKQDSQALRSISLNKRKRDPNDRSAVAPKQKMSKIRKSSEYRGVAWDVQNRKWRAQISNRSIRHYLGLYKSEKEAAQAINYTCDELSIARYYPELGVMKPNCKPSGPRRKKKSCFKGVYYDIQSKVWVAEVGKKKKKITIGAFETEQHA